MSQCDFIINVGDAIDYGRNNEYLSVLGNELLRTDNNHLYYGIPSYMAGLVYAMTICGINGTESTWYPASTDEEVECITSANLARIARICAKNAVQASFIKSDLNNDLDNVKDDLTNITGPTRNLWTHGDQSFSTSKLIELKNFLPAGKYCISAGIISTDTDTTYCRAAFYKSDGTTLVISVDLTRGERTHAAFTANDNLYFVRLFASTNSSTSSGDTATWTNIQLEDGSIETKYVPPITAVDLIARNISSAGSTVYISPTGSDNNNGGEDTPFATIQKAIDLGYKNICVKAGRYNQSVICDGVKNLNIYADNNDGYNSEDPTERAKPMLTNGEYFNTFQTDTNGYKYFSLTSIPSSYRRVFIDHSLLPVTSGSRPSYNAGLWANHSDYYNDFKIKPVLSYAELSEDNTFYFDGTTVYFHVENTVVTGVTVVGSIPYVGSFTGCDGLTLNGLRFEYAINTNLRIWNSNNVNVKNCDFAYTMLLDNVSTNFSNVRFDNCLSYKARNDGFNCHYYGVSVYDNCNALYNYDDGESSHEYCEVIVHGGEYAYNGKGGHAPVNGCKLKCDSTYAHHNNYGFYMIGSGEFNLVDIMISNSVALDNITSDLVNSYYNTKLWNCVIGVTKVNSGTVTDLSKK